MLEILNEGRSDVSNSSSILIILTFNVHFRSTPETLSVTSICSFYKGKPTQCSYAEQK